LGIVEVLIASIVLALVVISTTRLYVVSTQNIQTTSLRDAVNARISEDLEELRRESWSWACEGGKEADNSQSSINGACTGLLADADKPLAYKTGRCDPSVVVCNPDSPPVLARYKQACGFGTNGTRITQTTAQLMQQEKPNEFPAGPTTLPWNTNRTTTAALPSYLTAISIQRTITVDPTDKNQLNIYYYTASNSPIQVEMRSSLVPQALGWCP
jgi:hypothetical protein